MSSTSFIRLKTGGVAKAPDGLDGYTAVFPWAQSALDKLAAQLGVLPPSQFVFVDRSAIADATGGTIPAPLRERQPQPPWHAASDGVSTFTRLLDHIRSSPREVHRLIGEHNDLYSVELTVDVMRRILVDADRSGEFFRIEHEF